MIRSGFTRWIRAPRLSGRQALFCGLVAVALPTALRAAVNGAVTGCEFTPYLPFVLVCAILLRSWQAAAVAVASVLVLGGLFGGSLTHFEAECFQSAAAIFLASSAMIIGTVMIVRRMIGAVLSRGAYDASGGIIFSLEEGQVWASWHGNGPPVPLGSQERVSEMMEDFLAQVELGKRLTSKSAK
jgi:hypothetical protein